MASMLPFFPDDDLVLPSDLAVRLVEQILAPAGQVSLTVEREVILARARTFSEVQVGWWVDQVLGQLCTHGYVLRVRGPLGLTGYRASPSWSKRDEVISTLRPPRIRYPSRRDRPSRKWA